MSEGDEHIIATLTITRYLDHEGRDLVSVDSDDMTGGPIPVVEALGLLQLAIYDVSNASVDSEDEE